MSARQRTPKISRTNRENAHERRITVRRWKRQMSQADRHGRHDDAPRFRGTEGWNTW